MTNYSYYIIFDLWQRLNGSKVHYHRSLFVFFFKKNVTTNVDCTLRTHRSNYSKKKITYEAQLYNDLPTDNKDCQYQWLERIVAKLQ